MLLLQNQRIFAAEGAIQGQIDAQLAFVEELTTILDDPVAIERLVRDHTLAQLQALPTEERSTLGDLERQARLVAELASQEYSAVWFGSFLAYGPAPDWAQTTVPVLMIFGVKDVQVDAEQNAPARENALGQAGNTRVDVVILPNANHLFQKAETGSPSEYGTLPAELTPGAAFHPPPLGAGGPPRLHRARVAAGGRCLVDAHPFRVPVLAKALRLATN